MAVYFENGNKTVCAYKFLLCSSQKNIYNFWGKLLQKYLAPPPEIPHIIKTKFKAYTAYTCS